MTDDSADEVRTWPPTNLAAIAARLGAVTALGFGYWNVAFLVVKSHLADVYDAPYVVRSAHTVPNNDELLAAFLGVIVTISIYALGWASRSRARKVTMNVAVVLLPLCFVFMGLTSGWWAVLFSVGFAVTGVAVVIGLRAAGLIRPTSAGTRDQLKQDRHAAVALLLLSIAAGYSASMWVVLMGLEDRPVVLPGFGEVVILRSDSIGHFVLDDDQFMWLSRSKVDMIMVAPKSDDDTTTSENP